MNIPYPGELAALGTVFCWTGSALFFEAAGKRIGSLSVNLIRLVLALGLFAATLSITRGMPVPVDFSAAAWFWLTVSGIAGFTFGDMCLFRAFVEIGPRVSCLIMSLYPPMAALIGWAVLGESYTLVQWLGIATSVAGVSWVVADGVKANGSSGERQESSTPLILARRITLRGVLLALGGALGQAVGIVTGKHGMGDLDPLACTQIRVIAGIGGFVLIFLVIRLWPRVVRSLRDAQAMLLTTGGAVVGPFLGVGLMMVSIQHTSVGVTATFTALVPITLIPPAVLLHKERVTWAAAAGTVVAVAGVIMLVASGE